MRAALPVDEAERIEALHALNVLDTLPEHAYDDITRLAARVAETPMAVISFVDRDRQWFKSKVGLEASGTPRDIAFCAHAILNPSELFVVRDAEQDPRFLDNALVTSEPRIRFYAAVPLLLGTGHVPGTLCVMDHVPRDLTPSQTESLRTLARHVVTLLEYRQTLTKLEEEVRARQEAQRTLEQFNLLVSRLNRVQLDFIEDVDRNVLFSSLLNLFLQVTESEYGLIGEYVEDGPAPYLQVHAISDISWNEEARRLYEAHAAGGMQFYNLKSLFGHVITERCPIISKNPATDPRRAGLPPGHPPLASFMGIPLLKGEQLIGLVGMANRPGGYPEDLLECLQPYVTSCTYVIKGYRNRRLRAEAQEALKESQQRLELALHGADMGLWDWNVETGEVFFDQRWTAMLGYSRDEIAPHVSSWEDLVHPEDRPHVLEVLAKHLEGKTSQYETEHRLRTKSGDWKWILDRGRVVVRSPEGKPLRASGTHLDVTDRHQAMRALQVAKDNAETIIQNSPDMIIAVDKDRRIVEFNRAAQVAFGYTRDEVLGAHVEVVYADGSQSTLVHAVSLQPGGFQGEVLNRRRDGQVFPAFLAATALRNESGDVIGVIGISRDISDRKLAEAKLGEMLLQLEKSHEDLLAILNQLRLGIVIISDAGRVTFVSRTCQTLLGDALAGVVGEPWQKLCDLSPADEEKLRECIAGRGTRRKLPVGITAKDGRHLFLEIEVQDDPRGARGKILFLYDVTEIYDLRRELQGKARFQDLVGRSEGMRHVYSQILDLSKVDSTVLIHGETGTGKELVARAIHATSRRADGPFIAVNCGGLSESLVAGQLFGHRRGAFTGAVQDQPGFFEAADGGTLFLDEIGDIPLSVQTNLLRVLQEREVTRIGESHARKVDVRILAATSRDLAAEVAKGNFRQDLMYRVRIAIVHLPPLRARRDDIPLLVRAFLDRFQDTSGKTITAVDEEAMRLLIAYDWPGNVRELQNAVESAMVRNRGHILMPETLPLELTTAADVVTEEVSALPWIHDRRSTKRLRLMRALEETQGNRAAAAKLLGIGRTTLYRQLEEFGLRRPSDEIQSQRTS